MNNAEQIVLVDDKNQVLGAAPKLDSHNAETPLHRGFSVFLFDHKKNLLLQQRSKLKKTFPLVWSNSCCGHPMLNETNVDAAKRHLTNELGIKNVEVFEIISDYRYKVGMNGIFENEICPVLVCFTDQKPVLNKNEVEAIRWIPWNDFLKEVKMLSTAEKSNNAKSSVSRRVKDYSLWAKEESILLSKNNKFLKFFEEYTL